MGLVLQVQVIWVLLYPCMLVLGSSGVGEPLSLESYSLNTPVEAQVSRSGFKQGLVLKPSTASPSSKSSPLHQNGKGQPLVLSPTQSATASLKRGFATPAPHDSFPSLAVERPHYSTSPYVAELAYAPSTMVLPMDSTPPPVTKLAHGPSTMVSPVDRTPPPVVQTAHAPSAMVLPVDTAPSPVAESAHTPSATILPDASTPPPVAETEHGPSAMVSPVNTTSPPHPFDTPPVAKPPQVLTSEPPVETPPFLPTLPVPYESPQHAPIMPVLSPPSQMGPSQVSSPAVLVPSNVSVPPPLMPPFPLEPPPGPPPSLASPPPTNEPTLYEPPPPAGDTPLFDVSPSHAPSELPAAEPPHAPSLPLAANPPLLPVAEPPEALTLIPPPELQPVFPSLPPISAIQSPPIPLIESSPPPQLTPPIASSSPPQLPSLNASSPIPAVIPHISPSTPVFLPISPALMVPPPMDSSPDLPTLSPPMPQNVSTLPPQISPPHTSTTQLPPLNASSPVTPVMAPPVPQNASSMTAPPIATSTPSQLVVPPPLSPPTQAFPPSSSFSPPLIVPPPTESSPDLPTPYTPIPQNASTPPPQMDPLQKSSPPPQLPSLNASSPVPPLIPRISPPTPALPPSSSYPPPLMTPPPVPQNASSLLGPPTASSPPPQLVVPPPLSPPTEAFQPSPSISPPFMVPPSKVSPPNLPTSPPPIPQNASSPLPLLVAPPLASPPTSVLPSIPLASPPPMMLPPALPSSSPPVPTQAVPPLPHLVPPHSFSPPLADPPQVFSAPPPIKLPVTPPPYSSTVPGGIPPHQSSPPLSLSPPIASPPQEKDSPALASPPMMVPSHALFAPPPSKPVYPFVPPPPGNRTVPALSPHTSQRKVTQHNAPPPFLTSPDISPPSINSSRAAPPFKQVRPGSTPPISQPVEAPKHSSSSSSLNASEPHPPPLPAPPPSNNPDASTAPQPVPRHASPEPEFDRQNETAPAPSFFQVNPSINRSHNSRYRSPGAPMAVSPLPSPQGVHEISSAASPVPHAPPGDSQIPFLSPEISPSGSTSLITKRPLAPPLRSLPPPPPNTDCAYITCPAPSTNTPPGSPCGCVWPMQVGIRLSVALYTFFPLVSELAQEIASGTFLNPNQVRVMGANAAAQEPEKTIVLVDLLPLDGKFDNITSHLIFDRFYHKQVVIDKSIFGDYDVLYVRYPGLPPSPPMAPADIAVINGMPYSVGDPNGSKLHPLGVDVTKQRHQHRINVIIIAVIVLSAVLGVLICCSLAWVLVFRHTNNNEQPTLTPRAVASLGRSSGPTGLSTGSGQSSPLSLGSSLATYTGSAKTFSGREIEKATDNFNSSRILGEGGFGLVYSGDLDDDTQIAVKVLKRDDQQGGREFLAEVEMLSRLHHRNLVKLIGICTDERMRSLVYELIPNGSVDSHLHGTDKEIAPLDWASRLKIALGAARGLAYLHEDSSPRVIHRDFKSSNILLENDFTPKVSDFGLARSAMDEENQHISTRVMGTFGYVAPEYAMTGHLLVKSDVYSYGVVLLELLTGRKPVDMSMPAGQENLVSWTRPLLTTKEGLESIIDPSLGSQVPFESVAKVAAIASMCVQPEVSHRPFMGEVVQALKLVCNECDDSKDGEDSRTHSRENLSINFDAKVNSPVSGTSIPLHGQFSLPNYASGHDVEKGLSVSEIFCASKSLGVQASDSFRRHSSSGPLRTTRGRRFWQRTSRESHGSTSEHGIMYRLWASSH